MIDTVRDLLNHKDVLPDEQGRQLEKIRLRAAEAPGTIPEVVKARAEAEAKQGATQDGFVFTLRRGDKDSPASANDLDRILVESRKLNGAARPGRHPRRSAARSATACCGSATSGTRSPRRWVSTTSSRSRSPTTA